MATWQITRPSIDTSNTVVITGTVQATATLVTDYTVTGFDSFTSTAWQVTIPSGQSSVTLSIEVVSDSIYEPDESVFLTMTGITGGTIDGLNKTFLFTIIDDDSTTIARVVATGGTTLVGDPVLSSPTAGVPSSTASFPLTVRYASTNAKPLDIQTIQQKDLFDGGQVWVEFAFKSTANPTGLANNIFSLQLNGNTFKIDYFNNSIVITSGSGLTTVVGNDVEAIVQIKLFGGIYQLYLNGTLAGSGFHLILNSTSIAPIIWNNTTAYGSGYDVAGLRITRGRFNPTLGQFAP